MPHTENEATKMDKERRDRRVEAGAKAAFEWDYKSGPLKGATWESITYGEREWYRDLIAAALVAAMESEHE